MTEWIGIFLDYLLLRMGFGAKWREWTKECVSYACFSIIINGSPKGFFPAQRGIRQADPLSPFLFVIVAKAMSRMIKAIVSADLITSFKGCDGAPISLLQFVGDTLIFRAANEDYIKNVKAMLSCFEAVSSLKINLFKSELIGIRVEALLIHYVDILGCKVGHLPSYLGLLLCQGSADKSLWDPIVERV